MRTKTRCTEETVGVVENFTTDNSDNDTIYEVTIMVEIDGEIYRRKETKRDNVPIGTEYKVKYNPKSPDEFIVVGFDSTHDRFVEGVVLILVGGVLIFEAVSGFRKK